MWRGLVIACLGLLALPAWAVPVSGTVVQVDGLPAIGARVSAAREVRPFTYEGRDGRSATTDAWGAFRFDLEPGRWQVEVPGVSASTRHEFVVCAGQPMTLRLGVDWPWSVPPIARVPVRLVDRAGRPAAHRPVTLTLKGYMDDVPEGRRPRLASGGWKQAWPDWADANLEATLGATTDGAGRAVFEVAPGLLTLGLRGRGVEQVDAVLAKPGALLPERTLQVDAEPPATAFPPTVPPAPTWIRVLGPDGRPLARQWVLVRRVEYEDVFPALTDAQGMAIVRGFYDCAQFVVKAAGYSETAPGWLVHGRERGAITFRLTAQAKSLAGNVVDGEGRPVAGCRVFAHRPRARRSWQDVGERDDCLDDLRYGFHDHNSGCEPRQPVPPAYAAWLAGGTCYAETGADGSYRFTDLDDARWHLVFVRSGYLPEEVRAVPLDGRLDQVLRRNGNALRCRVLDASGRPWANRAVVVDPNPDDHDADPSGVDTCGQVRVTDADGWVRFGADELPACTSTLTVRAGTRCGVAADVTLGPHEATELTVSMNEAATVSGQVLLPDGTPAAGALVGHASDRDWPTTWTDTQGRYRLWAPSGASHGLMVFAEGCAMTHAEVDPDNGEPLLVRLEPGAAVRGRVFVPALLPTTPDLPMAGNHVVQWSPVSDVSQSLRAWRQGEQMTGYSSFVLPGLPPGEVRLEVDKRQDLHAETTVNVPSTELVELRVGPLGRGVVAGRVLDHEGRPKGGVVVSCVGRRDFLEKVTKADGWFRFDGVVAGRYDLRASVGTTVLAEHDGRLGPGTEERVELRLRPLVTGQVTGLPCGWDAEIAFVAQHEWRKWQELVGGGPDTWHWLMSVIDQSFVGLDRGVYRTVPERGDMAQVVVGATRIDEQGRGASMLLWNLGQRKLPSGDRRLDLALPERKARLAVDIAGGAREANGTHTWVLLTMADGAVGYGLPGGDGTLEFAHLPTGPCQVLTGMSGRACAVQMVDLAVGSSPRLTIRSLAGTTVGGRLAESELGVVTLAGAGAYGFCSAGKDGAWRIAGVPPGTYQARVLWPERAVAQEVVVGDHDVVVEFDPE